MSTTEVEYVVAIEAGNEMIWLHDFLDELGKKQKMSILHSDSQSAIFLAKNPVFHSKSKHIQMRYHFIRYLIEDKLVILEKISGSKNSLLTSLGISYIFPSPSISITFFTSSNVGA